MRTTPISYKRHRFPPELIAHSVWLYVRFNLSLREVEEMLLERGVNVSYETIRRWMAKFGPWIARNLRRRQARPGDIWHLDEVVVTISGRKFWLWRAVDQDGVVLEEILQTRRDKRAVRRLIKALIKRYGLPVRRPKSLLDPGTPPLCTRHPLSQIGSFRRIENRRGRLMLQHPLFCRSAEIT